MILQGTNQGVRPGSRGFVALLGALTGLTALSIDMSLPALPMLTRVFHTDAAQAQLTLSLFLIGFAVSQLVCGPLSDHFGRRPVLLGGLTLFVLAGTGCALSRSMPMLIGFRLLQGVGACVGPVLGRAVVRDLFDRQGGVAILSAMTQLMALAPLLAPTLGGYLLAWGWPAIFWTLAVAGGVVWGAVWGWLGESRPRHPDNEMSAAGVARAWRLFFGSRPCVGYSLVVCFTFSGMFAYISGSPFVLIDLFGVPKQHYGYYFALTAASLLAGAAVNGRMSRRVPHETLLRRGLVVVLLAGLALVGLAALRLGGVAGIMVPMMAYVFGLGLVAPNATAAAMEPLPQTAGVASSLIGCLQMIGGGLAGGAVGALYHGTPMAMAGTVATMAVAAPLTYRLLVHPAPHGRD